jgi:hypothetical protein
MVYFSAKTLLSPSAMPSTGRFYRSGKQWMQQKLSHETSNINYFLPSTIHSVHTDHWIFSVYYFISTLIWL